MWRLKLDYVLLTSQSLKKFSSGCLLLTSRSDVAILYNDRSVLENHHVSAAYRLMQEEEMNILVNLSKDDWRWVSKETQSKLNPKNNVHYIVKVRKRKEGPRSSPREEVLSGSAQAPSLQLDRQELTADRSNTHTHVWSHMSQRKCLRGHRYSACSGAWVVFVAFVVVFLFVWFLCSLTEIQILSIIHFLLLVFLLR